MVAETDIDVVSDTLDQGEFGDLVGADHVTAPFSRGGIQTDI